MAFKIDLVEGSALTEQAGIVTEVIRVASVTEITSFNSQSIKDFLDHPSMPQPGDSHPTISDLFLENRTVQSVSASAARVTLVYHPHWRKGYWISRGAGTLYQATLQKDAAGNQITVTHDGDQIGVEAQAMLSKDTMVIEFIETTNYPVAVLRYFLRKVNSTTWEGDPPGTWFCSNITYELAVGAATDMWRFFYTFEYDPEGWAPLVVYRNPDGSIPPALVSGVGIKNVTVYGSADFDSHFR
jgi:hypothetical protein